MSPISCISDIQIQCKHLEKFKSNRATKNRRRKSKVFCSVRNCSSPVPHPNFLRPESYSSAAIFIHGRNANSKSSECHLGFVFERVCQSELLVSGSYPAYLLSLDMIGVGIYTKLVHRVLFTNLFLRPKEKNQTDFLICFKQKMHAFRYTVFPTAK